MFIDFVLRSAGKDLLLAPVGHVAESFAANEFRKRWLIAPLARNKIRCTVADVFPQRGRGMAIRSVQRINNRSELVFEVLLFTFDDVIIHSDSDHTCASC